MADLSLLRRYYPTNKEFIYSNYECSSSNSTKLETICLKKISQLTLPLATDEICPFAAIFEYASLS